MATTTHLQNERLPFRVDLNPVEHCAQSEAANRTRHYAGGRRGTNHWTGWRKRAKVTPRRN
jgi:hypothetical protein